MRYPKILIVGQTFNKKTGGGVTMSNLFTGWPKDMLAVVCGENLKANMDTTVCDIYYQLGYNGKLHPFPLNIILPKIKCGLVNTGGKDGKQVTTAPVQSGKYTSIYGKLRSILHFLGLFNALYRLKITPDFAAWLKEYNPDIIYSQLSTLELIRLVNDISETMGKPVAIHMMDDWPMTIDKPGLLYPYWKKVIDREFRALINKSAILLSISQEMSDEYRKRYGREFTAFHNPIDISFWKSHQRKSYVLNDVPTVLYAGRIGTGIQQSLESTAMAIDHLNSKQDTSIRFVIQTEERPSWVDKYNCVVYRSQVPYSELPAIFSEADILILPYDFSAGSIRFIKFSMPTKAPEYMISGTPIIVCAPEETAIVKNAQRNKWAKIVTENSIEKLSAVIGDLVMNQEERENIASKAIAFSESSFNSEKVRISFQHALSGADR
jgi:glycosyltransferase involved in cell wall biosynthesis